MAFSEVDYLNGGGGNTPIEADNVYFKAGNVNGSPASPITVTVASDIKYIFIMEGYTASAEIGAIFTWDYHNPEYFLLSHDWQSTTTSVDTFSTSDSTGIHNVNGNTFQFIPNTGGVDHWYKMAVLY